jgi:hypothetical protein
MMGVLLPIFVVVTVSVVFAVLRMRQGAALAGQENQYAHARAGAVAQRMGITLLTGDPAFNFYLNPRLRRGAEALYGNALSNMGKKLEPECMVRMEGSPGGRRVELVYHDRMKLDEGVLDRTLHTWLDARLTVAVHAAFPELEVHTRHPNPQVPIEPRTTLLLQSFGDAALDAALVLKCADPRVGPVIGPALRILGQLQYVHIVGHGPALVFQYTQMASMGMGDADKTLVAMDAMARALEQAAAGSASAS